MIARPKDIITLAILMWLLLKDKTGADVNIQITEPGFEGENVQYQDESFSY